MIDETALRLRLEVEADSCHAWSNGPGTVYEAHKHAYRKILYCRRGSVRFELPATGESLELGPGDRLDLAPGTANFALVGAGGATCIEGRARHSGA